MRRLYEIDLLGVLQDGGLFARIQRLISRDAMVAWFREWAGIEAEAVALRGFEPLFVPGLLQTEAYARALLSASALLAPERSSSRWSHVWNGRRSLRLAARNPPTTQSPSARSHLGVGALALNIAWSPGAFTR